MICVRVEQSEDFNVKTIGMIGGMSWESTVSYYRAINRGIGQRLGGLHSAKQILVSVDFAEIEALQQSGDWVTASKILIDAAKSLELAGADGLIICTNTMHKVANEVETQISIPLLHIADSTADALKRDGIKKVGLLGTGFTMEQDFYKDRLAAHGLEVAIPPRSQREMIHHVIYQELCQGIIEPHSKQAYLKVVDGLVSAGAQAVILGCTEIGLLIQTADTSIALYDTTKIHADSAIEFMLA